MNGDLLTALKQIERERNIPIGVLQEAVEQALTSAYRKTFDTGPNVRVAVDWASGGIKVIATLTVVPRRKDPHTEISLSQARKKMKSGHIVKIHPMDPSLLPDFGDEEFEPEEDELFLGMNLDVIIEEDPKSFGRIAAQTTKQVILQKIKEAERDIVYTEYSKKEGDIVSGIIQRNEHRNWIVDLGRVEAIIPPQEQVPTEHFRRNERIKAYVLKVEQGPRGAQVILSRSHPGLVRRLFELEVPEIQQGLIAIHNVVREPGARSKVSVRAVESNVDPLGACVGPRGSRVQMIVDELRGEKIDIINYTDDPFTFVSNALSPARVMTVTLNPDDRSALVIVPDNQFSLAIGKEGQNARLAAKLTNWKIDIKSETQAKELEEQWRREEEERKKKEEEERKRREEERKRQEEEERKRQEEERKRLEEEQKRLAEEELQKKLAEAERLRLEEEERIRREEEERRLREEERLRIEEEERRRLLEHPPEIPEYVPEDEDSELIVMPQKLEAGGKELEEILKDIPDDIPVEEYVAMAFRDDTVSYVAEPPRRRSGKQREDMEPDEVFRRKKKPDKKGKRHRRGMDFDEEY